MVPCGTKSSRLGRAAPGRGEDLPSGVRRRRGASGPLHWTSTRVASPQSSGRAFAFHPEVTMTHNSYEMEGQDGRVSTVLGQLPAEIAPSQLTALDQFHAGGAESVERLLSLAERAQNFARALKANQLSLVEVIAHA